jgi:hypothetical protein
VSVAESYPIPHVAVWQVQHPMEVWSDVHRWLERAYDNDWSICSASDVFNDILRKQAALWVVRIDGRLVGCFVTKIEYGSKGRGLNVVALGGEGLADWVESFDMAVTHYAKSHNCRLIAEMGRPGWIRVLGKLGWSPGPPTMMKVP